MLKNVQIASGLPIRKSLRPYVFVSVIIAFVMAGVSLAGLLNPQGIYPAETLRKTFVPNDVVNLFIGLPILFGSMALASRGKWIGLLFWPGALFFVSYNFMVYSLATPVSLMLLAYLALVVLSVYGTIGLVASLDADAAAGRLKGRVPERLAGGVLAGLGGLFLLRVVGLVVSGAQGSPLLQTELALNITDFLFMPAWILGGIALWRHQPLGYAAGLGLLFQGSMLFIGLIMFFILQPILTSAALAAGDMMVIAVMGCIFFVPFGLFVRGVLKKN